MAWFSGKVNLGNFPDLAGAVNKLSESVKNIEKNFDNALGFEEKSDNNAPTTNLSATEGTSSLWPSSSDRKTLFDPFNAFMGHKSEETTPESPKKEEDVTYPSPPEEIEKTDTEKSKSSVSELPAPVDDGHQLVRIDADESHSETAERKSAEIPSHEVESDLPKLTAESSEVVTKNAESPDALNQLQDKEITEGVSSDNSHPAPETEPVQGNLGTVEVDQIDTGILVPVQDIHGSESHEHKNECKTSEEEISANVSPVKADVLTDSHSAAGSEPSSSSLSNCEDIKSVDEGNTRGFSDSHSLKPDFTMVTELPPQINNAVSEVKEVKQQPEDYETHTEEPQLSSVVTSVFDVGESTAELEKLKKEMKMMETALQGAARQAQAKADEIARMMNENEQLKSVIDDLRRQSNEAEIESLREEYHQRVATLERKVYALTKERDTLRREQNRKSDAAALLKEKDEIINQVMAEGEELSKKQAAQESQIRKLRAQIREFEEEKKSLTSKLQVEENKVESIKKDKAATEKLIQETIEKHQAELAVQKEYYTNALTAAKEAEALAEARANNEARTEVESRLREAEDREAMLVQALEELRQTLSRHEQQAVYREDMLKREIEDLQKRYQASERRCEELITQVPDSTRPLLRQIEAMQETTSRKAEAWAAVERSLTSRLQEAETKAAAAEERERSVNDRLSQTLSRINVLEAQISCLRAEQTQISRSLEKERNRAAENRQEYLAAKEEADTQEGRANQLEEEIKELRRKHKQELQEELTHRELLLQEVEREKSARLELERTSRVHSSIVSDQSPILKQNSGFENGNLSRKLSTASSLGSMKESHFLQASLDSSDNYFDRRNSGEATMSPYYMKSMTPSAFEATLRQKEGELASYMSRLASMESIRDSLAEELVNMTAQCEKLRAEASTLPGIRAELEALRRRHTAALELMGERDEELEELRADIVDLKEMYREQVNMLVNKIQIVSSR